MTGARLRSLLGRCADRGVTVLVWDGDRFHRATPEAVRGALRASQALTTHDGPGGDARQAGAGRNRADKAPGLENR